MKRVLLVLLVFVVAFATASNISFAAAGKGKATGSGDAVKDNALQLMNQGRETFRFDTFGDEAFWEMRSSCIRQSQAANWEESGAV